MAKYWKQFKYPKETTPVAVIQGEDKNSAYLCAGLLEGLGYKKLWQKYLDILVGCVVNIFILTFGIFY